MEEVADRGVELVRVFDAAGMTGVRQDHQLQRGDRMVQRLGDWQGRSLQGLEKLLAHDVVFRGDGGGKAPAAARAIHGRPGWRAC